MTSVSSDVHFGNAPCAPTAAVGACFYTSLAVTSLDRKSTRLNSSHSSISYAVFCLKKKNNTRRQHPLSRPRPARRHLDVPRPVHAPPREQATHRAFLPLLLRSRLRERRLLRQLPST